MRPSSMPRIVAGGKDLSMINMKNGFKSIGCPVGTVPIRRTTKDDIIRAKLHSNKYGTKYNPLNLEHPGHHYAIARTKFDPSKKYVGGGSGFSFWNPPVQDSQFSSGRMKIQNGQDSVEVGWTVNPTLYGHNLTHVYTYLNAGQSQCYNMRCPGFVHVDKNIPVDGVHKVSTKGEWVVSELFAIHRDPPNGNWWLHYGYELKPVGFWPQSLFTGLRDLATTVEWGGEVFSPPEVPSPPMGTGEPHIKLNTGHDAVCKFLSTIHEGEKGKLEPVYDVEFFVDNSNYDIKDGGFRFGDMGHVALFGGPGGATGN